MLLMLSYYYSMKALSLDLRQRIAAAIEHDAMATYQNIADPLSSVERIARKKRQGRSLAPATPGTAPGQYAKVPYEHSPGFERLAPSRTDWTLQSLAAA